MPIILLNFYDVVSKRDFSMNVTKNDYIWSSYKTLKLRIGALRRDYTVLYDGEVLNRHNKWSDYNITDNSTIILLEKRRQSRFTESSFNYRSRSSIAPLLTTFSADGFPRERRLPAVPPPPPHHLPPPPPPPRRDRRLSYSPPRPRIPPGIIGHAVYRGQPVTSRNSALQDFTDIQSILRTVIQNEEDDENVENNENQLSVQGRSLSITNLEAFPPLPPNDSIDSMDGASDDNVERVEEIRDTSNVFSVLEANDEIQEDGSSNLTLRIRVDIPPQLSEPSVRDTREHSEDPPDPSDNPPDPSDNPPDPSDNPPDPSDNPPDPSDNPPDPSDNPPDPSDNPPQHSEDPPQHSADSPDPSDNPPDPSEASNLPSNPVMVIDFYRSVYSNQVAQLLGMGYTNEALILEALMLNQGDVMDAVDWMA